MADRRRRRGASGIPVENCSVGLSRGGRRINSWFCVLGGLLTGPSLGSLDLSSRRGAAPDVGVE